MDSSLASESPDTSDIRPSFRKPSNDASNRKYRRHSPVSGSSSPSSSGGLKRDRSISPNISQGDIRKAADSARKERRTDGERESVRDYDRSHGRRGIDTHGTSERHSYGRNREYHGRSEEYSSSRRHGGNDDKEYQRYSSRSGRDSRSGARSEYLKRDDEYDRLSRDDRRNFDRGSKDKGSDEGSKKRKEMEKDREKDNGSRGRYKNLDRETYFERSKTGNRHSNVDLDMEEEKRRDRDGMMDIDRDKDESRDRGRNRDDNREYARDAGDNREHRKGRDDVKGRDKDDFGDRDEFRIRSRDKYKSGEKDLDTYRDDKVRNRRRDDVRERDPYKEKHIRESDRYLKSESRGSSFYKERDEKDKDHYCDEEGNARKGQEHEHGSEKVSRSARDRKHETDPSERDSKRHQPVGEDAGQLQGKGTLSIDDRKSAKSTNMILEAGLSEPTSSTATEAEVAHDLNVAKLAAMKAAELVNKNLGVSGCMSADQKKKLLWGSKKAAVSEESVSKTPWEMARFADPDRQEKFNKLMGVKGDLKTEKMEEEKDGGLFAAEKQKELQQDLEKQFTAGLRRRDGRTVGLGL